MKSTSFSPICPVPGILIITGLMILSACGYPEEGNETLPLTEREPVTAHAARIAGFRFEASPPDTVSLKWSGEGSAVVTDIHFSPGLEIQTGDTLFNLLEDLHIVEMERLSMELDMASAMLSSDSLLRQKVDSLTLLLDSLLADGETLYISPLKGTVEEVLIAADQRIRPGSFVADVSVASSELFQVFPPPDCIVNLWPEEGSGIRFIEERPGYAVYSGELPAIEALFSELLMVPRFAVFESELESYVITTDNDTIPVFRAGETNNHVIILPMEPLTSNLLTWAE